MQLKCSREERRRGFSNAVVLMQPCQGDAVCFCEKAKALYLTVQTRSFACNVSCVCVCVCVCVWERERERQGLITVESAVLTSACVQTHTSFITVSVTWLCSSLRLELMVKLTTLLTVFIFTLKAEARDYGKVRYISDARLWCSANHNALC